MKKSAKKFGMKYEKPWTEVSCVGNITEPKQETGIIWSFWNNVGHVGILTGYLILHLVRIY